MRQGQSKRPENDSEAVANDGGTHALAGFIFQMLATAADVLRIHACNSTGTELLFEVEKTGQDLIVTASNPTNGFRRTLVQYKFSGNPSKYPIHPNDLNDICKAMVACSNTNTAASHNGPMVTYRLVTNRPLSDRAKQCYDKAKNKTQEKQVTGKRVNEGPLRKIARKLEIIKADTRSVKKALTDAAHRFGLLGDTEHRNAVSRVIALLVETAQSGATSREIKREDLHRALAGYKSPRPLEVKVLSSVIRENLAKQRRDELGVGDGATILPRESAEKELATLGNEAIVVIHGEGGCGKSQILFNYLMTNCGTKITAATFAGRLAEYSVGELVAGWRSEKEKPDKSDSPEWALDRLVAANPDASAFPILLLGLDGLDELGQDITRIRHIRAIFDHFWSLNQEVTDAPPARLIVTCRSRDDMKPFLDTRGFGPRGGVHPRYISVGNFTDDELVSLAERSELGEVSRRIGDATRAGSRDTLVDGAAYYDGSTRPAAPEILEALHHPVIWRCFIALAGVEQTAALDGTGKDFDCLCKAYLNWFCDKASLRSQFDLNDLKTVLRDTARASGDSGPFDIQSSWDEPVGKATGWPPIQIKRAYREALSSGIIVPAGDKAYFWKFNFFRKYLREL